jgi:uncharacterized protein (TIGR02145 family)
MKTAFKISMLLFSIILSHSCKKDKLTPSTVTDADGNIYKIVTIGTQVWMAENLKTTKYNDGTAIPNVTDDAAWASLTTGAYCDYPNAPDNYGDYGRLYNWFVVDNNTTTKAASNGGKNVCPVGWHAPTDTEWTNLTTYLGGENAAGGKMKETGTIHHWLGPNTDATNSSGFSGLPGGFRLYHSIYSDVRLNGYWWSSTGFSSSMAFNRKLNYQSGSAPQDGNYKQDGFSVRCLKDQ